MGSISEFKKYLPDMGMFSRFLNFSRKMGVYFEGFLNFAQNMGPIFSIYCVQYGVDIGLFRRTLIPPIHISRPYADE